VTAVVEAPQAGTEAVSAAQATVIAIMAADVQIGVLLDANAPISVMTDPLLKVVNSRLREVDVAPLQATGRGRWMLCLVDGTPLRSAQSLTEQDVYDGDRLWLRFVEDTEHRSQVIEHISTAVSTDLSRRFAPIDPVVAAQVGAAMVAVGVLLATGLLGWWRCRDDSLLTAAYAAGIAVLVLTVATLVLMRSTTVAGRRAGDMMLLSGIAPLAVAAAGGPPGPVGAPHAVLACAVAGVCSLLVMRFTGRRLEACTAIVTICAAATVVSLARMLLLTGAVTLMSCVLLACVIGYHAAPSMSRWLSGIRLPVFPSATSRWVFQERPDLPTTVVVSGNERATLDGPASVRDVLLRAEHARAYLTGLLIGLGALVVVCCVGLCDPHTGQPWLPLLLAGSTAGFLVLRGRSYVDRWQAITLAVTGVIVVAAVVARYVLVLPSPVVVSVGAGVLVLVPAAGLTAAVAVPNTIYSPLFRKFVEWIEYLCLMPIFPLALWLMNVYAAIRYR
jgi:type VII secretion integral membrane protein EccD